MVYVNLSKITSAANRRWAFRTKWIFFVKRSNSIKSCWLWIQSSKDISESQNIFKSPFLVAADWQRFKWLNLFWQKENLHVQINNDTSKPSCSASCISSLLSMCEILLALNIKKFWSIFFKFYHFKFYYVFVSQCRFQFHIWGIKLRYLRFLTVARWSLCMFERNQYLSNTEMNFAF